MLPKINKKSLEERRHANVRQHGSDKREEVAVDGEGPLVGTLPRIALSVCESIKYGAQVDEVIYISFSKAHRSSKGNTQTDRRTTVVKRVRQALAVDGERPLLTRRLRPLLLLRALCLRREHVVAPRPPT